MKIGFVIDDTLDKPDGVQQYVLAVSSWMASRGHEVHFLAGATKRTDLSNVHSMARNVSVQFNGNRLTIPLPVSRKQIAALLEREQFDVLHVQMPHSPLFAQRIIQAAGPRTAVVGTFHILPHGYLSRYLSYVLGYWLRQSFRRCDAIVAVSDAAGIFAHKAFRIATKTIPNTIDLGPFLQARPKPTRANVVTIAYLNRLEPRKGAKQLIDAVRMMQDECDVPFRVLIGGKGSQRPALERMISEYGLSKMVSLLGFVAEADKPQFLADADVVVYPSTGGESFGIVLLEGMAATQGVVVAGNNPGYASVMAPFSDQLVDPNDTATFAQMLTRYVRDGDVRRRCSTAQHDYARSFDVTVVGPTIEKMYTTALHARRSHAV